MEVLQTIIKQYINKLINDISVCAALPDSFTKDSFQRTCNRVKQKIQSVAYDNKLQPYPLQSDRHCVNISKAVEQVRNVFDGLDETVIFAILNKYSSNTAETVRYRTFGCAKKCCLEYKYDQCQSEYICGPFKYHKFELKQDKNNNVSSKRSFKLMSDLRIFAVDYYIVQKSNTDIIPTSESCVKLNVTKNSMNNYLTVIHCMELRKLTFSLDICDKTTRKYIKETLKYANNDKCYKDKDNSINAQYIPDLTALGVVIPAIPIEIEQKGNAYDEEKEQKQSMDINRAQEMNLPSLLSPPLDPLPINNNIHIGVEYNHSQYQQRNMSNVPYYAYRHDPMIRNQQYN